MGGYVEDEGLLDIDGGVVVLSSVADSMGVPACGAVLGTEVGGYDEDEGLLDVDGAVVRVCSAS